MARIPSWVPSDDGQWLHAAKDYASTRFSSLGEIDTRNAANLRLAFSFSTGVSKGHEAAPLVVGSTMYIVTGDVPSAVEIRRRLGGRFYATFSTETPSPIR